MNIKRLIRNLLASDSAVTDALATFRFTTGGTARPAIFTSRNIPDKASFPVIHIASSGNRDFGCRDQRGTEATFDVHVYDDKDESNADLEDLAHDVWKCLHRASVSAADQAEEGIVTYGVVADAPVERSDPDQFPGYLIQLMIRFLEVTA